MKKATKTIGIIIIVVMCLSLVLASAAEACVKSKTWIVSSGGTGNFTTIQAALSSVSVNSGDTILVKRGTYSGNLVITKTVTLKGEDKASTIIDGGGATTIINVEANNVVINAFTIRNAAGGGNAIWENGYTGATISNNIITNTNGDGIRILNSHGNTITGNMISNCPDTALGFNWAYDNTIQGNRIENNYIGIGGGFEPCYSNIFFDNTIANNAIGIQIDFSKSMFYHNNIINNGIQVSIYTSTFSIAWDNGYPSGGNYWSSYTGVDNYRGATQTQKGHDGIGDTPYVVNALNVDHYPLMKPLKLP